VTKNKLLFLIDRIEAGGAERQMLKVAELYSNTHDIHIASLHTPDNKMLESIYDKDFKYHDLTNGSSKSSILARIFNYIFFIYQFRSLCKTLNCKKVISFLEWSNVINIISTVNLNINSLLNVRNYLSIQYGSRGRHILFLAKLILKFFYNRSDAVYCNSCAIKQDLSKNFKVKPELINVLYNIYDIKELHEKSMLPIPEENVDLLNTLGRIFFSCGRIVEQKRMLSLAKSFEFYVNMTGNFDDKLIIMGSGELKSELKEYVSNAKSEIILIEHDNNPYPYFKKADFFVLNSSFEGFPNVLSEAVILDCYPISVDCLSGPREIISNFKCVDYDAEINDVNHFESGTLVRQSEDNSTKNIHLVNALADCAELQLSSVKLKSKLLDSNFGKSQWQSIL